MNDAGRGEGIGPGPITPDVARSAAPDVPSDEALQSLERLQALGAPPRTARVSSPVRRPRMPSVSRQGLSWPRIAAPIVFLAAVLIVFTLAIQSGVVGGDTKAASTSGNTTKTSPKPSTSVTVKTYKVYVIKTGDTLSAIAAKFDTSASDLEDLNPKLDLTTLQVGQKIKVPR